MTIESPQQLRAVMGTDFEFSEQQFAAISAPLEPAVVVAGAGSGKTAVMAARVVWLVATGRVDSSQVLGLTFTTKAANELSTRIRGALVQAKLLPGPEQPLRQGEEDVVEPTVATYNAYAAALLTEHGLRIGHEPDTRVVADASRYQLAARALRRHRGSVELLTDHLKTAINYVLAMDSQLSEHLLTPQEVRDWQRVERPLWLAAEGGPRGGRAGVEAVVRAMDAREELLELVESYRVLKRELGLMDFSDQIELGARLAIQRREVGRSEREKFTVVLLDEYQDTSVAQALMLSRLFSGGPDEGLGHPVTAVGDPNQAIYGWRGASVSNILNFGRDFPVADPCAVPGSSRAYSLTVNRRSDRRILEVANELAQPLYALSGDSASLEPTAKADKGTVRAAVLETYDDELAFLAREVTQAHAAMPVPRWSEIGVLTRDNDHAGDVYDVLTLAGVPVEIVGLKGLLRLPEVAEVVATLELLHDLTANASLLTLLVGPRWAIGPRDLALLGRRASRLARQSGADQAEADLSIDEELAAAVEGSDPADLTSLSDAVDDPGGDDYSAEARERFALLSGELRTLRGHVGEPLLDLVRRIIDTMGIDIELASSVNPTAQSRRENLDLFVKAVADFQAIDGDVSLAALLAYLTAEDEYGNGLDAATPTEADSVKLLTVHRAKGLEWDVVFLVGVCDSRFPNTSGRSQWLKAPSILPIPLRGDRMDLPQVSEHSESAVQAFPGKARDHEQREELRLGYVAFTRARHVVVMSAHCWRPGRKSPLGGSPYLFTVRELIESWGEQALPWTPTPDKAEANPVLSDTAPHPWPVEPHGNELALRRAAADLVLDEMSQGLDPVEEDGLDMVELAYVSEWDEEIERLLEEARASRADTVDVPLPSSLSATVLTQLRDDPQRLASTLARPMPRKPSPSARFGTRFHAWVEARFGQQQILDPDDLPGRGDAEIDDDTELQDLVDRFNAGPFADRTPFAIEPPFSLVLGGQVVRGRIDAVYETENGYLVVDWKTNRAKTADPLQLAIYRVAWAEVRGVALEQVEAAFYYVRTGELERYSDHDLADRAQLEDLVNPAIRLGTLQKTQGLLMHLRND